MKRASIIVALIAAGLLSIAFAAQPGPAPAPQDPGTYINSPSCPANQPCYQGQPIQPWRGQASGRGRGLGPGGYQQQQQCGQGLADFGRSWQRYAAGGATLMRQGRGRGGQGLGRQGQGLGRGMQQQTRRSFCRGGCGGGAGWR